MISTATDTISNTILLPGGPHAVDIKITTAKFALTADGDSNTATSINTATDTVDKTFLTDTKPVAIVVVPTPPVTPPGGVVVLKSGHVGLGITQWGDLTVPGQTPSSAVRARAQPDRGDLPTRHG